MHVPCAMQRYSWRCYCQQAALGSLGGPAQHTQHHSGSSDRQVQRRGRGQRPTARMQQGGRPARHVECKATAAYRSADLTEPQHTAASRSRQRHTKAQAAVYSKPAAVQEFRQPPELPIYLRLERIAAAVPGLDADSRVIDVGTGTGVLIQHLQARGVRDILAVDLAQPMLDALAQKHPPPGAAILGNEAGVRTWCGDIVDVPAAQGPADAVFFNACFGNMHDQHAALRAACRLLRPGGHVVISHPLGRDWCSMQSKRDPALVPHTLPDTVTMQRMIHDLPLRSADDGSGPDDMYLRVLQVPEGYVFDNMFYKWDVRSHMVMRQPLPGFYYTYTHKGFWRQRTPRPLYWKAEVVQGFGHGSRDLGFPTASLDPRDCRTRREPDNPCFDLAGDPARDAITPRLNQMPNGVYFGFAKLVSLRKGGSHGLSDADLEPHGMVMNIGERPMTGSGGGVTLEVHVFDHKFAADFYGKDMTVLICGFLRPEMKFDGVPALTAQISTDIGIARMQLALPKLQNWRDAKFSPGAKRPRLPRKPEKPAAPEQPAPKQQPVDPQDQLRDRLTPITHKDFVRIQHMADRLNAQPGRPQPASIAEIAGAMGRAEAGVERVVRRAAVARLGVDLGVSAEDSTHMAFARQVRHATRELHPRQMDIICHRYGLADGASGQCLTVKQVGELYGLDDDVVREHEAKAKAAVKSMLEGKIAFRKYQAGL